MALSALFLVVACLLSLLSPLYRVGRRPKGLPPGPPTIPVLGNIHLFPKRDVHLQYQKWAKEYGPIYSLILGTKTMIVLSSSEVVRDLLDKRSAIYSDRQGKFETLKDLAIFAMLTAEKSQNTIWPRKSCRAAIDLS